ncbi:mandelate racemase/muconate lactonizing enzyme family protein [Paraburkholderia sp. Ac-20336]|uniref:mandelate racemase/muconate lactonizing enzyme family protein n=1 Tax=Paraburkholderia sp. Ac-20336 TaxID=2703886 RepID=UPI00197F9291|nr:mandelate racemase/muconate lactonizing enzyme family protein [Paraburkholderia sp. Ac-20336]MBN3801930.1 mandelate racemase/muconate lactonizing enzyme family protein [Paraburkholderia sp. Ac-20336]
MPKISSIDVCTASVPLDRATSFSNRSVAVRHYGLVKVRSDDGVQGIGFCYIGSSAGRIFDEAVAALLAPVVLGRDSYDIEGIWSSMYQESLLQGRAGVVMRAISAIDTALWDLNARTNRLPLHRYLGAALPESVPAYASGGYYLDGKTDAVLADEMRHYVELGFRAVKMKTGRFSPKEEASRVRAAREAVGKDVDLMLDCNNAWLDLTEALRYVRRFEEFEPYFIEEPFGPDDIENHARLARGTQVPIATAEIGYGRWYHKALLDCGGASILQTDAAVCGGITEWKRIAATASSYGVVLCPHWFHDLHAPLVAATPNARYVELFPDDQVLNFRRLIDRQLEFKNGRVMLHQEPGLGFDFDEVQVGKYAQWQNVK